VVRVVLNTKNNRGATSMVNNSLNEWKNPVYHFDGDDEMILVIALVVPNF
jgi:hypothetical protein